MLNRVLKALGSERNNAASSRSKEKKASKSAAASTRQNNDSMNGSNQQNDSAPADVKDLPSTVATQPEKKKIEITKADQPPGHWPGSEALNKSIIKGLLSNKDMALLAQASRFLYHRAQPVLKEWIQQVEQLAPDVIVDPNKAKKEKVISALMTEPRLLETKIAAVRDRKGRFIKNKTLFQLAYGAGDDDFCRAMKPAFIKLCGDEKAAIAEMERQRNEIRESKEVEAKKEADSKAHLAKILAPVMAAMDAEQFDQGRDAHRKIILRQATLDAIKKFRIDFAESQPKEIDKGPHFRYNTLQEILAASVQAAARWKYNYKRCALFEDGVLSTVLSYAPDNDEMRFSQGLYYLQKNADPEPFNRSLALREGEANIFDDLNAPSADFADLQGSCVDISFGTGGPRLCRVSRVRLGELAAVSTLMSDKNIKFGELMQPTQSQPRPQ